jgi:hypothetical protein
MIIMELKIVAITFFFINNIRWELRIAKFRIVIHLRETSWFQFLKLTIVVKTIVWKNK